MSSVSMDYNENHEETTLSTTKTPHVTGTWSGDTRSCEQGQIIYNCSLINRPINMNNIDNTGTDSQSNPCKDGNNPIKSTDTNLQANNMAEGNAQPVRFGFANSQPIRTSLSSSSDSSDSSKTTTWGQVKASSPTKCRNKSKSSKSKNMNTPNQSPTKNKNERTMTSWKDISPTKSSSSSDLEHSHHSNKSNEFGNRMFRFSNRMKEFNDSSTSSDLDPGQNVPSDQYSNEQASVTNQVEDNKCNCKASPNGGSPCKKSGSCNCSKNCTSHSANQNNSLTNSNASVNENENGSPKKEKGLGNGPDELCDNEYYYEDDFTVQFDTNLRETSVTPIDSDPNTTILDFPNMVTGSYLCFNNGGSSNVSFNNSKASSNISLNNMKGSNFIQNLEERGQYDSEFSGNSGSHNSTMEMSSSERDMMGSSDMIDLSDGPLFTPTPSHILSTDSLDRNAREHADGQDMSGSNGSGETNLNVDCCPRKEEYFLSFDGSHSRVSGSETDISLSFTSHDSCTGHWASHTSHESTPQPASSQDRSNNVSSNDGQEETSDSFHICFNKLSPKHKGHQYSARDNLTGRVIKKLVTVKETIAETGDSSDDERVKTSPTLTAGSKELSSLSPQTSPKKVIIKPLPDGVAKIKGKNSNKKGHQKGENLYLVGIGKPAEILRKAAVHSHTLPRVKNLVSWKQVKGLKTLKKGDNYSCVSLPELSTSTSWQNIAALKGRKLSEVSESFHGKRHSASLFEFYQRMKSQSNPVSPETMNNLEQILWPNFIGQKPKPIEMSDSSASSQECGQCLCCRQNIPAGLSGSVTKAYTNKRIFDWLKMECSSSSRESNRPTSLACQTANPNECFAKETLISPQTVTLWCGTKTVGSQFPPVTKECGSQTLYDVQAGKTFGFQTCIKKDQGLQTSDFEEEEILSMLSDNFDDFNFLCSNEGIAKDFISCPEHLTKGIPGEHSVKRSKSVDEPRKRLGSLTGLAGKENSSSRSYQGRNSRLNIGRSKSAGRLGESPARRMGISHHYSFQSLPDLAFLTSSVTTLEKEESQESLFDPMKLDLPTPVTIAPKTELEQFSIFQQNRNMCSHEKSMHCCEHRTKVSHKTQTESGSSSSGISSCSASSGLEPGYCDCRSRSNASPENDLERLIFFPPHMETNMKNGNCGGKRRAQSVPACLSECTNVNNVKLDKYANEIRPQGGGVGSKGHNPGLARINQKWNGSGKNASMDSENGENLYALVEEQTPVTSPDEQPCCHRKKCNGCKGKANVDGEKGNFFIGEQDFTESDFYRAIADDKIIVVENDCYRGMATGLDSTSSSGSSVPNFDRKPLKSCLRKRNRALRSRSLSAADGFNLNFDDMEEKVKNRHSYACDEVYIVSDEHGQLMMYQADDSAEPVMFYLDKDGECHMTEGTRNHEENFGSFPNFDIQANDSIHGSDSSTERDGSSGKRKSVSFASEVSFQSISPAASPKKMSVPADDGSKGEPGGEEVVTDQQTPPGGEEVKDTGKNEPLADGNNGTDAQGNTVEEKEAGDSGKEAGDSGSADDQGGNSSSSDSAPEEFRVTMDTNDNLWPEDLMQEKIALLMSVSSATESLIAHFAKSTDTFDKLRLGNTSDSPELGDIVVTRLCSALSGVVGNGLKHHLAGFQMFGRVQVTVWKLVEASVEIMPQTRALCDLVARVKQTTYLTSHQQRFMAFVFGLLNLRLLDYWMCYIRQRVGHLTKFYEGDAILVHADSSLKKHYDDIVVSLQPLAVLPFQLNMEFIREKALTDSKLKSQDMTGSKEGLVSPSANQNAGNSIHQNEAANENAPTEVTSVLEFTASRALNWLASATFSKRKSVDTQDMSESRSKSSEMDSTNKMSDSNTLVSQMSGSFSYHEDTNVLVKSTSSEKLSDKQRRLYCDAKMTRVDSDHIISPSASIMKSSQNSLSSLLSTISAKLDFDKGEATANDTASQSMTSSATSLVSKLMQFGSNVAPKQTAYKKGVTEYSFDEEASKLTEDRKLSEASSDRNVGKENGSPEKGAAVSATVREDIEEVKLRDKSQRSDNRNSKRVSFDIVNIFDKLLLPSSSQADKRENKPPSRIPVPKSRWSWGFGSSKPASSPSATSPAKTLKPAVTKSDSEISKKDHFPKRVPTPSEKTKTGKVSSVKTDKNKVGGPPKPPRVGEQTRTAAVSRSDSSVGTRAGHYDVHKQNATL